MMEATTTVKEIVNFREQSDKEYPQHNYLRNVKYPSAGILENVEIKCSVETEPRMYSNGEADSIKKVIIEIDLSKSQYPWQPHTGMAEEFGENAVDMVMKMHDEYLDFCAENEYDENESDEEE